MTALCLIVKVAGCYPDVTEQFPQGLMNLLRHQGPVLDADMRMVIFEFSFMMLAFVPCVYYRAF